MELNYLSTLPQGGFNFDMCIRNKALAESASMSTPVKTMKTGTTICGVIFKVSFSQKKDLPGGRISEMFLQVAESGAQSLLIKLYKLRAYRMAWCWLLIPVPLAGR